MSVSGWETRPATSAMSMDDRRARQIAAHFGSQQPPPPPPPRSRQAGDMPSHHQSFPVQPPHHAHSEYPGDDAHQRRQVQMPYHPPPPSSGYYDDHQPRRINNINNNQRPAPSPQRPQQRKQYEPANERANGDAYANPYEPPRPPQFMDAPPPPPAPASRSNGHYSPQQDPYGDYIHNAQQHGNPRPYPYPIRDPQEPRTNPADDTYVEPMPPPLHVRRGAAPAGPIPVEIPDAAVRRTTSPSPSSSSDDEPPNIDDVLLGKRWSIHVISPLYQFTRQELGEYAHELVKFLRGHAVMSFEQEFGYSVMIRYTSECVAFQVIEARDLHAELLIEKMEQPQRFNQRPEMEKQTSDEHEIRQRTGSFVVYFPKSAEDSSSTGTRPGPLAANRAPRPGAGAGPGSDHSSGAGGGGRGDPKYVFLLRGNEELMAWVCSWVQRRFQCVVGLHVVRVTEENLRRVARNWVIEALEREDKIEKSRQRRAERLRKISAASGEDMTASSSNGHKPKHDLQAAAAAASWAPRAPLLLKYRSKTDSDAVKAFTLTMPWANVRRVHALMNGGVGSALGTVPEVIERLEHLYFGNLQKDLSTMALTSMQMDEQEVDTQGKVKVRDAGGDGHTTGISRGTNGDHVRAWVSWFVIFTTQFYKSTMVHSVLQSFLDIFVVQQVQGPTEPATTF